MKRAKLLVVDDEPSVLESIRETLSREGYEVVALGNGEDAIQILRKEEFNLLLTDLMMPKVDGIDLLKACRKLSPETEVVLITAYGTIETAVKAMKEGAYDFVSKPLKRMVLLKTVQRALERQSLVEENKALRARLDEFVRAGDIIGKSTAMRRVLSLVNQVAPSTATVLIQGESGTGKELIATALHDRSKRASGPFMAVNCAALPESILESELFGFEPGAFTGAAKRREGRFEAANKGTLFLDEIADLAPQVQVKLLRVLQNGTFERLGSNDPISVDVRVVAATNADLKLLVEEGRFREDLFYRLNVITIVLPPLRERVEDIPLLANHFLQKYARKNSKPVHGFSPRALELLMAYTWPGNVRELENAMERAVVLCQSDIVHAEDLPQDIADRAQERTEITFGVGTSLKEVERRMIEATLAFTKGDKRLASQLLGIAMRTIYRRLAE
ncbi:MAG: sigma-54-dependent Fis family transcriptional regulator [Deltaproteobacteria bacterium]|nr:sigma-54-dependent Fis family transcriptional regulator [Deltaproteobacteria bacterium]